MQGNPHGSQESIEQSKLKHPITTPACGQVMDYFIRISQSVQAKTFELLQLIGPFLKMGTSL